MRVNKVFALFAVVLMLACPLVVFITSADQEGATAEVKSHPDATHISLTDLDKDDIIALFVGEDESNNLPKLPVLKTWIALGITIPGFNILGLESIDLDKLEVEGANIEFDYLRDVNYGESTDMTIAISIDVKKFTMVFDKTIKGMYMLASDACASTDFPEEYRIILEERYMLEEIERVQGIIDNSGIESQDFANYMDEYKTLWSNPDLRVGSDPTSWTPEQFADSVALINYAQMRVAQEKSNDPLYFWEMYRFEIEKLDQVQQMFATGEYGLGIRETYSGKTFDGGELTISGSIHGKIYLKTHLVTEKVSNVDTVNYQPLNEVYVITETGLNPGAIRDMFLPGKVFHSDFFGGNQLNPTGQTLLTLLNYSPLQDLKANIGGTAKFSHGSTEFTYKTDIKAEGKFTAGIEYDDMETLFRAKNTAQSNEFAYNNTFFVDLKEVGLSVDYKSTFESSKGSFEKKLSLDLTEQIKDAFDSFFGTLSASEKTMVGQSHHPVAGDKVLYESWFGFIINQNYQPTSNSDVALTVNAKHQSVKNLYSFTWFDKVEFKYAYLLSLFSSIDRFTDELGNIVDSKALTLINECGGEASHDVDDAENGIRSIQNSFGTDSSDNSAMIIGILLAVIIIFAIIAFALIIKRNRY